MACLFLLIELVIGLTFVNGQSWHNPNCVDDRVVAVQLFEWKWSDVARECEQFLGPRGFCAVQVSPAFDHVVIAEGGSEHPWPWWQRYQPVGYNLDSRSGSEAEFFDMVSRCNAADVRIYVDAVINHMAGVGREGFGIGGSEFRSDHDDPYFPNAGYEKGDFNGCEDCGGCCCINAWMDHDMVRNCPLLGLIDLNPKVMHAQDLTVGVLNKMIDGGVAGFRIDAAKHMWPEDLVAIFSRLNDLSTEHGFPAGSKPFVNMEVIDMDQQGEVNVHMYTHIGRVTEFRYCVKIIDAASYLGNVRGLYDPGWGMCEPENAYVFVDNHDNQRGHGSGSETLTHKNPIQYQMGTALTLAQDYGWPRIMSSYEFDNSDEGPPHNADWTTVDVIINPDGSCGGGWVCEHRWPAIAGMAGWAKAVNGYGGFDNWWEEGNKVAWSRGGRGFVALSNEGNMSPTIQTGLPPGDYCNVVQGCPTDTGCEGQTVTVDGSGMATIDINYGEPHILAIHVQALSGSGACIGDGTAPPPTTTSSTTPGPTTTLDPGNPDIRSTIIYVFRNTEVGQDVFLRGGLDHSLKPECANDDDVTSACAVSIQVQSLGTDPHYDKYNQWGYGDAHIDWFGAESGQGKYEGLEASGTPAAWTTNDPANPAYQPDNTMGEHWWKVELIMDCTQTEGGWFDFKGYGTGGLSWESDIAQSPCTGSGAATPGYSSSNHIARCGFRNIFTWGSGGCEINEM